MAYANKVDRMVQYYDQQLLSMGKRLLDSYETFDLKASRQITPYWALFNEDWLFNYETWNQIKIGEYTPKEYGCNSKENTDAEKSTCAEEESDTENSTFKGWDNETDQSTCAEEESDTENSTFKGWDNETDQSTCTKEEVESQESTYMDFEEEMVEENSVQLLGSSSVVTLGSPTKIVETEPEPIMKLRNNIWQVLKTKVEEGETVSFSYVLKKLGVKLDDTPVVLHALLQLANEKRLDISEPEVYIKGILPRVESNQ